MKTRIERLEEKNAVSGVVGIMTARGGTYDPVEQARVRQRIAELRQEGYQIVYFANLGGLLPGDSSPRSPAGRSVELGAEFMEAKHQ